MRRPWWHRALSACLTVWFALVMVEPSPLHSCPMHSGGHAAIDAATATSAAGHGAHGVAAEHSAGRAVPETPAQPRGHVCTCLGDCSGSVAARAPEAHTALVSLTRPTRVTPGRPQHEYVAAWVDFVLPFATAPPATV